LAGVKKGLDIHGMIPHSVHSSDGSVNENARGSSMALMLIFLQDIDFHFAQEQFQLFKENFVDTKFGLTGIREYPKGESGTGDIDSGPVIFGFGGAATIVGMQTLSRYGEHEESLKIRNAIEALSFSQQNEQKKTYFFGALPIADGFIAWSHAGMNERDVQVSFIHFRLSSIFAFVLISALFWVLASSKKFVTS
jgi:hypothetical protein